MSKRTHGLFDDDGNTSLMKSEPRSPGMPSNHVHTDPDGSNDDNDNWM
jgi:hypothetical protein